MDEVRVFLELIKLPNLEWTDGSRFRYRGWNISKSTMQNIIIFVLILVVLILGAILRVN